jgi:hypothetical protein
VASERTVEPVIDSSRYFVLTLEDNQTGRRAFLGLGFNERSEAFDFNAALADHKKWLRQQQEAKAMALQWNSQTRLDLSLPPGQTIHVDIKVISPSFVLFSFIPQFILLPDTREREGILLSSLK